MSIDAEAKQDARVAYGARCTWWGSIHEVAVRGSHRLPCCPHCGGVLFEVESRTKWDADIRAYVERTGDEDYAAMVFWSRGKCFPSNDALKAAWLAHKAANG